MSQQSLHTSTLNRTLAIQPLTVAVKALQLQSALCDVRLLEVKSCTGAFYELERCPFRGHPAAKVPYMSLNGALSEAIQLQQCPL